LNELLYGPASEVELVAGDFPWEYEEARLSALPGQADPAAITAGPWALLYGGRRALLYGGRLVQSGPGAWRFGKTLDLVSDPYLDQHRLDGVPVLPFAVAMEYMAEVVAALGLEADVLELEDVRLLQGLRLLQGRLPVEIDVCTDPASSPEQRRFDVVLGRADGEGKFGYRASVKAGGDVSRAGMFPANRCRLYR